MDVGNLQKKDLEETICKYQVLRKTPESHGKSVKTNSMSCQNKTGDGQSNIRIEIAHRVGENSNDNERAIVVQFSFYNDEINILKTCRKLKRAKISIFKDFFQEAIKFVKKNGRRYQLTETKVRIRTSSIEVLFAKKGEHQYGRPSGFSQLIFFIVNLKHLRPIWFSQCPLNEYQRPR